MKALCWYGTKDVRVSEVPDPVIINPHDVIIRTTLTAICGSDLHLYDGFIPTMEPGDILGHEFMGIVVETGKEVRRIQKGDRVLIPFTIACGQCFFCSNQLFSSCDNSNPNAAMAEELFGFSPSGLYGYSHMLGGYAGGQAQFVRVPFADVNAFKIPESVTDEQVLFLTDIFPTGYMAAENCSIKTGDTVAVWGAGPVGQFCIKSAYMFGADRVIAIDDVPERLTMAREQGRADTIDFSRQNVYEVLCEMTGGRGPDSCIDAVGMEAHGMSPDAIIDSVKTKIFMATDRAHALRQAINCCRKGGTVSIPGVYAGALDKFPLGAAHGKGLTFKMGQTHVHRYLAPLLERIENKEIDPSFVISHRLKLSQAAEGYKIFAQKADRCTKIVLEPD